MRLAAVDVGTNSILLTIAEPDGRGGWKVLDDRCRVERLGQGVGRTGVLADAAMARALDALGEYAGVIHAAHVDRVGVVGTQALREAQNGAAFVARAQAVLGVPLEIIAGRREAELSFAAVVDAFPELATGPLAVIDVGGGSTELIVGDGGTITSLTSLPIGAVRLAERHGADAAALLADIRATLAAFRLPAGAPLVAVAGTATTLAAVAEGLVTYDAARVQGLRLPRATVDAITERFLATPIAERMAIVGLDPRRADVIHAGAAILSCAMAQAQASELVISDRGLRFGLLAELARA